MSTNLLKSCRILSDVAALDLFLAGSVGVSNRGTEKKKARSKTRRRIATSRNTTQPKLFVAPDSVTPNTAIGDKDHTALETPFKWSNRKGIITFGATTP